MKCNILGLTLVLTVPVSSFAGPYAPAAGQVGSTAISKDDSRISGWASGYVNYLPGSNVDAQWMDPTQGVGQAQGTAFDIVSLGRGGQITMSFDRAIYNGAGDDFAVFENSFSSTFLELAWVEVSSDGNNFFRFPGFSLQGIDLSDPGNRSKDTSVGAFGLVDPTNIDGLAGKYAQGWGTPFDLDFFSGTAGVDVNNIRYIRLLDIIGDGSQLDNSPSVVSIPGAGNINYGPFPIYDPYPTTGSAGFDLDGIGAIYVSAVPVPAAIWLFGSALLALLGLGRRKN